MKTTAQLGWNLWVECPHCGHDFDLADHDEEGQYSKPIFSNKWDDLKGEKVECPQCCETLEIDGVEY